MALTGQERARIRKYLGWTSLAGSGSEATSLERTMDAIANHPDDETEVRAELARAEAADTELDALYPVADKAVQVGSVKLRAPYQMSAATMRGREAVLRMAAILDVDPKPRAAFGAGALGYAEL